MPIELRIEADTAEELVTKVCAALGITIDNTDVVPTTATQEVAPPVDAPKPSNRRGRPPKNTVSDAASAPSAAPETAAAAPSTPSQAAAVETLPPVELEPKLPFEAPKEVTQEAMNEVLRSLSSAKGLGAVTDILGQFNCQRVKEVKPESRGDVIALAQAALAS